MVARFGSARAFLRRPVAADPTVRAAAGITALGGVFFAAGPGEYQLLGVRALVPVLAALTAAGMWRVGADRRLTKAASQFWLLLSLALLMFTAGMVVDFALGLGSAISRKPVDMIPAGVSGETLLFPVAGVLAVVALVVYPSSIRSRPDRAKIGLDVAIVLFGGATFVWYFLGSSRWHPDMGWDRVSETLVLPALVVVAGFAVLRITLAGADVICRRTMACFVFAAAAAGTSILLNVVPDGLVGRFGSWLQVLALSACVLGMAIQRRVGRTTAPQPRAAGWRRPFATVPYLALAAAVLLLVIGIAPQLADARDRVAAVGVAALWIAVVARQYVSLWENNQLLAANQRLSGTLHHHAYHDPLTGLANRTLFAETVANALARAQGRRRLPPSVLFVDLDDFKLVNDGLGHHVGDEVLVAAADRLRATVPQAERLCRLGGDEFAILLENVSVASATTAAEAVLAALSQPYAVGDVRVRVAASIGIATESGTSEELLRNADMAMYAAKRSGGGWRLFDPEMLHWYRLRAALVRCVTRDGIEVVYEPVVDLGSGRIVAVRALPRWRRPSEAVTETTGELIGDELRAMAEETGVVGELDRIVLAQACRQVARWGIGLQVGASHRRLLESDLVASVERAPAGRGPGAGPGDVRGPGGWPDGSGRRRPAGRAPARPRPPGRPARSRGFRHRWLVAPVPARPARRRPRHRSVVRGGARRRRPAGPGRGRGRGRAGSADDRGRGHLGRPGEPPRRTGLSPGVRAGVRRAGAGARAGAPVAGPGAGRGPVLGLTAQPRASARKVPGPYGGRRPAAERWRHR